MLDIPGLVTLEASNVLPLLTLADKYNVSGLSRSCVRYMSSSCFPSTAGHVFSWLQYAIMCGYTGVEQHCWNFLLNNFQEICYEPSFLNISLDLLLMLLQDDNLVVQSEWHLYCLVKRWFQGNIANYPGEKEDLFLSVMEYIRFPMFRLSDLTKLDEKTNKEYSSFLLQNIFKALKFHTATNFSLPRELLPFLSESVQYTPRVYASDIWSTGVTVENVSQLPVGEVRGAFFTTPYCCSETSTHQHQDWHLNFYPRGVVYSQCEIISCPKNLRNPGGTFPTVRLALSTNCSERRKFKITVLVKSSEGNSYNYMAKTVDAIFDANCTLFNMNGVIPYDEVTKEKSVYKIGDEISLTVVIRPQFCQWPRAKNT